MVCKSSSTCSYCMEQLTSRDCNSVTCSIFGARNFIEYYVLCRVSLLFVKTMSLLNRNDAFTIIWKIHNFSMCPEIKVFEDRLFSPTLTVDMLDKTDWRLNLELEDINGENSLLCTLHREGSLPLSIIISYSIEVVSIYPSKLKSKISCQVFKDGDVIEVSLGNLDEIYNKKDILLPSDILTVQCCMWKSGTCNSPKTTAEQKVAVDNPKSKSSTETTSRESKKIQKQKTLINYVYSQNADKLHPILLGQMYLSAEECLKGFTKNLLPNKCVVRTQIELERRSILWAIKKFSDIKFGQKIFMPFLSIKQDTTPLILAFYLVEDVVGDCELRIDIQSNCDDEKSVFVKCAITITNAEYEDRDCFQDARLLTGPDTWHLILGKKNKLLGEEHYLKNDTLFLRCEFAVSWDDRNSTAEIIVSYPELHRNNDVIDFGDRKKELIRIHKQADFSDIVLKVGDQYFCSHKIILCASSTYFRDMLSIDFKEEKIEITDCEPDTLEKLLEYMYSGILEQMRLGSLIKLYSASIKFQVLGLKRLCSFEMRATLEVSNVCDVLNIADLHKDQFLMMLVGKFISEFSNEVFHSSEWKLLMECNPKLTGKVMHEILTNVYTL